MRTLKQVISKAAATPRGTMLWFVGHTQIALLLVGFLSALVWTPSPVSAAGFRIMDQSASATGQSAAFTAQADDPSAIYYNPAGMTQLRGVQTSFGALLIGGSTSFRNSAGATARGDFNGSVAYPPPINLYITANLKDLGVTTLGDLSAGVGVLSPFGTLIRWPDDGPFSTALTRAALQLIDVKPTLAYKLNDQLSIGLGADIYTFFNFWGEGQGETKLISSASAFVLFGIPPGSQLEINGRDTAAGFNVSLLYTPFRNADGKPLVNVGFQYRSQATLQLDGQFLSNGTVIADTSSTIVLPQVYTAGIAFWPVRDDEREWKWELDVDYTGWKSIRDTDIHFSTGQTILFPRRWRSTYTIMVGTEHKWQKPTVLPDWEIALRGGYWNSQTPIPDSTFSPSVPDADNHSISIGLGLLCKGSGRFLGLFECGGAGGGRLRPKEVGIDLAYQALLYETRTVSGNTHPISIPNNVVNGTYKTTFHIGSVNFRINF